MNPHMPTTTRSIPGCTPADPHRRGTVLILVVAVLAILVIMGAAYLRNASSASQAAGIGDDATLDAATQRIIDRIRDRMRDDLYGDDGVLLNADTTASDTGETLDENYDYPHNAVDSWLASNGPSRDGTVWPHATWLGINYLGGGDEADAVDVPVADPTDDADLGTDDLADADGDGIADSRWFRLPSRHSGEMEYIAAVRVVDLSGMANANIGLTMVDPDAGNMAELYQDVDAAIAPRWHYPAELDFGRFTMGVSSAAQPGFASARSFENLLDDVEALMRRRLGRSTNPMPVDRSRRDDFWTSGWENGFPMATGEVDALRMQSIATVENELELRHRNGLNANDRDAPIELLMPNLLRLGSSERDWSDVDDNRETYLEVEPRHRTTVLSAAAPYYMRETDGTGAIAGSPAMPLRVTISPSVIAATVAEVEAVLGSNADTAPFALPADSILDDAQKRARHNAYARQVVANLFDAVDMEGGGSQTVLWAVPDSGGNNPRFGLEALPFITEVYRQRTYKAEEWEQETAGNDVNGDGTQGDGNWYLMLNQDGDTGYAIELRNPFNRTINLEGITLGIGGDGLDGDGDGQIDETDGSEGEVTAIALSDHATEMGPDEALIIYHNPGPGTAATDSNIVNETTPNDDFVDSELTMIYADGGAIAPFEGNEDVKLELRVGATEDGSTISTTLAYQEAVSKALDDSERGNFEEDGPLAADPGDEDPPIYEHKIVTNRGSSAGINMLTFTATEFGAGPATRRWPDPPVLLFGTEDSQSAPASFDWENDQIDELGLSTPNRAEPTGGNVPMTDPDGDTIMEVEEQFVIPIGTGRLENPGLLAMLPVIGPSETATVAEAWGGATTSEAHMLDPKSAAFAGTGDYALPHALLLLDRFASDRYDLDGIDNDADGRVDEGDEAMIPGRINLNTVDEKTLADLLPMPEAKADGVAAQIIAYRDRLDASADGGPDYSVNRGTGLGITGWRNRPGIAVMGEVFAATDFLLGGDTDDNKQWAVGADFRIDFTPADAAADDIVNDREEAAMIVRWLSQVTTTRSDTFAAYIVVRGYDRTKPITGGDSGYEHEYLAERKRVIVLFDRSPALEGEEEVAVRAVMEW